MSKLKRKKKGSRWDPTRYGMIGWLWKSYLSPLFFISIPLGMFGYVPAEDKPLREDPLKWRLTLLPHFKNEHQKILRTGNNIFKYIGAADDYVAKGLADYTQALVQDRYYDIYDYFSLMVTEDERDDVLKHLAENPHWVVHFDEYTEVERIERQAVSANVKLAHVKRRRADAVAAVAKSKDVANEHAEWEQDMFGSHKKLRAGRA